MKTQQEPRNFQEVASSVFLAQITVVLTFVAIRDGIPLIKIAASPGLGWSRWVLVSGELALAAMLVWLWYCLIRQIIRQVSQRQKHLSRRP